jgi:hypothetical protein
VPTAVPIRSGSRAAASSVANEVVGQRMRAPRCGEAVSWGRAYFITLAGLKSPSNSWPSQSLTSTYHRRPNGSIRDQIKAAFIFAGSDFVNMMEAQTESGVVARMMSSRSLAKPSQSQILHGLSQAQPMATLYTGH